MSLPANDLEEDEVMQDWSSIAKLANDSPLAALPRRGEKDYEPDGTDLQELLLYRARDAMYSTLEQGVRGAVVKSRVVAYYDPQSHSAVVPKPRGNFLQTMGESDAQGALWLEFFEFMYLAERGTVTPCWKRHDDNNDGDIPLSIEDMYALFKDQQEMDNFAIYAQLKRLGFIVQLASPALSFHPPGLATSSPVRTASNALHRVLSTVSHYRMTLFNGFMYNQWSWYVRRYTSSPQIYESLNKLIQCAAVPHTAHQLYNDYSPQDSSQSLNITFNVWKPNPAFKKKLPELPDFQVATYNKNSTQQSFPTYKELQAVFRSLDYKFSFLARDSDTEFWDNNTYIDGELRSAKLEALQSNPRNKGKAKASKPAPPAKKMKGKKKQRTVSPQVEQMRRLKNGYRSFLLAVMDNGITSFAKISEADFGSEDVWYKPAPGQKNNTTKPHRQTSKIAA